MMWGRLIVAEIFGSKTDNEIPLNYYGNLYSKCGKVLTSEVSLQIFSIESVAWSDHISTDRSV